MAEHERFRTRGPWPGEEPWRAASDAEMAEHERLWWWVLDRHAHELQHLTRTLNPTAEQREMLTHLQAVHRILADRWREVADELEVTQARREAQSG